MLERKTSPMEEVAAEGEAEAHPRAADQVTRGRGTKIEGEIETGGTEMTQGTDRGGTIRGGATEAEIIAGGGTTTIGETDETDMIIETEIAPRGQGQNRICLKLPDRLRKE